MQDQTLKKNGQLKEETIEKLSAEIRHFAEYQLGLHPTSVFVNSDIHSITVSINGVLPGAERNAAKDKHFAELIMRAYTNAFRTVRGMLEIQCSSITGRNIEGASLHIDPESNHANINLPFTNE